MKSKVAVAVPLLALTALSAWLAVQNASLRRELDAVQSERKAEPLRRPRMKVSAIPDRAARAREERIPSGEGEVVRGPGMARLDGEAVDKAVADRIKAMKEEAEAARERRREAIAALTPEQKEAQRDAFLSKMRERSQRRMQTFVSKAGLSSEQTSAFEGTVAAIDATLRETADAWAEQIRSTGTFSRDAQVKFVGEVSAVLGAGYSEMDATLPESWRTEDGNVNLMEIVGPEALSSMVEALTESGLEDGLQTIGQVMGGPEGGPGAEGEGPEGDAGDDLKGIESPGVGGGPGGGSGMGGPGGGFAPPAGR